MIVPENEIIYRVLGRISLGELIQRLILTLEHILFTSGETIFARPSVAESESYPRMKHAEEDLKQPVVEYATQEAVSERNGTKTVAMPKTEMLSFYFDNRRLLKLHHAQFLEIRICPYIMIALEEIDLHSLVHKILKSREHTEIALRDNITILVPEIPDITEKVYSLGILRQRTEKTRKAQLAVSRIPYLKTQMYI